MAALLRTKRLAWAVALGFAVLVLVCSFVAGRRYQTALAWVDHTQRVHLALAEVLSDLRDEESAMRGYVISGASVFAEGSEQNAASVLRDLERLRSLVRDNPVQAARAATLSTLALQKLDFIALRVALKRQGADAQVNALVSGLEGKVLMDRIVAVVKDMENEEGRLLAQRSSDAAATQRETVLAIAALAFVLLVLLVGSFVNMQRDAKELRQAASELAESEERFRVLIENTSDLVTIHDLDGQLKYVSPSVESALGYGPPECKTLSALSLVHPEDMVAARYSLEKFQSGASRSGVVTCRIRRKDGEYRCFEFRVTRVDDESGKPRHVQASGRDVTVRRQLEQRLAVQAEELRNLSLRDGLTGLYNRRGFMELSQQVVRVADRERHRLAILFVDLDGLKGINDELGHGHGDRAIIEAADLLRSTCRATDLVARLGGDEFVVLAGNVDDDSLEVLKGRLARALSQANAAPHRDYRLSFSLGVATYDPQKPVAIDVLMTEADTRMYEEKARRRPRSRPAADLSSVA
jgi:diguanylate cyclase (GGDEF)-like protein/PAS domain S-box-containing protein